MIRAFRRAVPCHPDGAQPVQLQLAIIPTIVGHIGATVWLEVRHVGAVEVIATLSTEHVVHEL